MDESLTDLTCYLYAQDSNYGTFRQVDKIGWNRREVDMGAGQSALTGSTCGGGQRTRITPSSSASFLSEEEEEDLETLPGRYDATVILDRLPPFPGVRDMTAYPWSRGWLAAGPPPDLDG